MVNLDKRKTPYNSTFAKWRVEEVLVRSISNHTFVASRQVEVPNPPIRKSSNRYRQPMTTSKTDTDIHK
jgi:hypothetical protein